MSNNEIVIDQSFVNLSLRAIERIKTDSELKELWEENDASERFTAIDNLEERLRR